MNSPHKTLLLAALIGAACSLATRPAQAAGNERPVFTAAYANSPGMVTLQWAHSGEDVYRFDLYQESPFGYRPISRDTRIWTVPSLQPSTTYRYKVCAVYAYHQKCSDEDGAGLVAVKTMPPEQPRPVPTKPPAPPAPPKPEVLPAPVIRGHLTQHVAGAPVLVNLQWINPVGPTQYAMITRIDWYRNGAYFNSSTKPEMGDIPSLARAPNETLRYKLCIENAVSKACSNEISVVPLQEPSTTVVKGGTSSAGKRALHSVLGQPANPSSCKPGYVWRVARASDLMCVTPASRDLVAVENRNAAQGVQPGAAPYCRPGLVWRDAFSGDGVCVSPQRRDQVHEENRVGASLRA